MDRFRLSLFHPVNKAIDALAQQGKRIQVRSAGQDSTSVPQPNELPAAYDRRPVRAGD